MGPGEAKEVCMELLRRDISTWDVGGQDWVTGKAGEGGVEVWVGGSSRDLPLWGEIRF